MRDREGLQAVTERRSVWPYQVVAHLMAFTVQFRLNSCAKLFVRTEEASKPLQHHCGKREEGEALVSNHHTQLGRGR